MRDTPVLHVLRRRGHAWHTMGGNGDIHVDSKTMFGVVAAAFLVALLSTQGCTCCHPSLSLEYNFKPNTAMTAKAGSEMLEWTERHTNCYNPPAWLVRTLSYSGKDSARIRMVYRERPSGMPRVPVTRTVVREFGADSVIVFQATTIRVLSATESTITFVVLADPSFELGSGME